MSDTKLETLLDGFEKSSRSLTSLQEGILDLQGVMEQFHKATEDFTVKNEIDTLLPKIHEHFIQANDVYSSITENLRKIQIHTQEIQVTGQEMVPAYQKLQAEVEQLKDMQSSMTEVARELSSSIQEMSAMQKELTAQMSTYRQMMIESRQMQGELLAIAKCSE
jgi:chromosome segregation ATPase